MTRMETSAHTAAASRSLGHHGGPDLLKQMSSPVLTDCPGGSELIQCMVGVGLKIGKCFDVFYVH